MRKTDGLMPFWRLTGDQRIERRKRNEPICMWCGGSGGWTQPCTAISIVLIYLHCTDSIDCDCSRWLNVVRYTLHATDISKEQVDGYVRDSALLLNVVQAKITKKQKKDRNKVLLRNSCYISFDSDIDHNFQEQNGTVCWFYLLNGWFTATARFKTNKSSKYSIRFTMFTCQHNCQNI